MTRFLEFLQRKLRGQLSEKEQMFSTPLRAKFSAAGVEVGLYSYGCFDLSRFPSGVRVGRYCSIANTARVILRNHGVNFLGMTAMFYWPELGVVDRDPIPFGTLSIGDDVWIGHNATILPGVGSIGRGAVIAAGAIVTRPVPSYAIVAGNPARIMRLRFSNTAIDAIEKSRWWECDPAALRQLVQDQPDFVYQPEKYFARD
jgi:acetyltransferase-like isoleucine patch superfamily enzyme